MTTVAKSTARKPWKDMSEKEINDLKRRQCVKCQYLSRASANTDKTAVAQLTCDYIAVHGHSRGCDPRDCVEKGVFKKRKGARRKRRLQGDGIVVIVDGTEFGPYWDRKEYLEYREKRKHIRQPRRLL